MESFKRNLFRDKVYFPNLEQQKFQLDKEEENIELTDAMRKSLIEDWNATGTGPQNIIRGKR